MSQPDNRVLMRSPVATALSLVLAALLPGTAQAFRLDYKLGAAYLRSDNIRLDESGGISDSVFSPQLQFQGEHDTATLQTSFMGALQHLDYVDNSFEDELRGEFSGRLNWVIMPERMHFLAENRLSQQSVNNLAAYSPGNQQQTNVFKAGPSFFARLGATTRWQLDLFYTDSYAEQSTTFNGNRYTLAMRLDRQLNPTDSIGLNLEGNQVKYDEFGLLNDYKRYDAYVNYTSTLASVDIRVDAGSSRLEPRNPNFSSDSSPLLRGNVDWRASPHSVFSGYISYQFADATQNLIFNTGDPGTTVTTPTPDPNLSINAGVFSQRRVELGYTYNGTRAGVRIQPYFERIRYLSTPLIGPSQDQDQDSKGTTLNFNYRLLPQALLVGYAARRERTFVDISREDRDSTISVGLAHQFSRNWSGQFNLQRRQRDSSISGQDYKENAVIVAFFYSR